MKTIQLAVLLFSLLFSNFISITTASITKIPSSAWLENFLRPRANGSNPKPDTFICTTTNSSPFMNHVTFGTEEMKKKQGHHWCTQDNRDGCTDLVDYGTAFIVMCGDYRTKLRCYFLADALDALTKKCTEDTGAIGGRLRVSGRAVFDWGYLEVKNTPR